jgi:hypothetical protein
MGAKCNFDIFLSVLKIICPEDKSISPLKFELSWKLCESFDKICCHLKQLARFASTNAKF